VTITVSTSSVFGGSVAGACWPIAEAEIESAASADAELIRLNPATLIPPLTDCSGSGELSVY
jgi:hypothetical protein